MIGYKIHSSISLPSTPRSSKWSLSLILPHQAPICTSPLPRTCYMFRPYSSRFDPRIIFAEEYRSLRSSLCSFQVLL